jgi:hypothetical protein
LVVSATLAGSGYFLDIDRIYLGGKQGSDDRYIGYLQNFYMRDLDLLSEMRGKGLDINSYVRLPPLIYHPVTFPELNTFIELPALRVPKSMVLHFMFKTKVSHSVIYSSQIRPNGHLPLRVISDMRPFLCLSLCSTFPIKTIGPKRPSVLYGH